MKSADSLLKNPTEFTNLWLIKKKREDWNQQNQGWKRNVTMTIQKC
jgi:hypothetical protein